MTPIATASRLPVRVFFAAAALLFLANCAGTPQNAQWANEDSSKANKVVFLRQTHVVHFAPGKESLSAQETADLKAFLAQDAVGYGDRISLMPAAGSGDPRVQRLALRRGAAIAKFLDSNGIKAEAPTATMAEAADTVTVVVGRYVVIPPRCPDWRKPSEDDPSNTQSSNLGCATETNLGLMVADPGDLIYGKSSPYSDGEYDAYAIQRYREGTIKMPSDAYEQKANEFGKGNGIPKDQKQ